MGVSTGADWGVGSESKLPKRGFVSELNAGVGGMLLGVAPLALMAELMVAGVDEGS